MTGLGIIAPMPTGESAPRGERVYMRRLVYRNDFLLWCGEDLPERAPNLNHQNSVFNFNLIVLSRVYLLIFIYQCYCFKVKTLVQLRQIVPQTRSFLGAFAPRIPSQLGILISIVLSRIKADNKPRYPIFLTARVRKTLLIRTETSPLCVPHN